MVGSGDTPLGRVVPRRAAGAVADALADTRVVLVIGARQDFRGLRHLADRLGDFLAGIVLYTGTQTLPFGPRLRAMPVSSRPG